MAPGCLIRTSMLFLITDRVFILLRYFFGEAVAHVFLEIFLCFFQQFDRLANVSRARFIGLFLDPLSILRGTQRIVSVNYLFGRPLIPSDFLETIVTLNFRDMRNLMSVAFGLSK